MRLRRVDGRRRPSQVVVVAEEVGQRLMRMARC